MFGKGYSVDSVDVFEGEIMTKFNEDTLSEQPAIEQLKKMKYVYLHGDELDPELKEDCERSSRKEVVLVQRLKRKLAEINDGLTYETIDKAVRKITHIRGEGALEVNREFHRMLISGISIDQDVGARRQKKTVKFIEFDPEKIDKNEFLAVNQFWVKGPKDSCRPDIVIFINGIPMVVIECKSPISRNAGIETAISDLLCYQRVIPSLFRTNEVLIGCNLFNAQYGALEAAIEHFHEWKDPLEAKRSFLKKEGAHGRAPVRIDQQEVVIASLLKKENLLDILQNFIVYDYSKETLKLIKKICRYQQFIAVNKIYKRVLNEEDRRGIIWHWQGSGKSLIMIFAAMKLRREEKALKNPMILIVTDRKKLDRQIKENFDNAHYPNPIRAMSQAKLYEYLKAGHGATIMTTVQKFRQWVKEPLTRAKNVIVLTDEAHRSQYGAFGVILRKVLPNAAIFAFTGTPLNKKDRNTYRHFSPEGERYLDRYTIKQAEEDRAIVPVKIEERLVQLQVVGRSIDELLKELFPDYSDEDLKEIKRRYATIDTLLNAPRRIERIAMDIVEHFRTKVEPNGFKAQIVANSRAAADKYKEELDKLIGEKHSTVIMTVNSKKDPPEWKEKYKRTDDDEETITGKDMFQDPKHPLKFIIVCDKLLTGFDAPIEQVMYLDQRMKEHTLLQAVARTNRPYPRKTYGLIVDYVGVGRELAKALSMFDKRDLDGLFSVDDMKWELEFLKDYHKEIKKIFSKINLKGEPKEVLQKCLELLRDEAIRLRFDQNFRKMAMSMDMLMPDPMVEPYLFDFKFFGSIYQGHWTYPDLVDSI